MNDHENPTKKKERKKEADTRGGIKGDRLGIVVF